MVSSTAMRGTVARLGIQNLQDEDMGSERAAPVTLEWLRNSQRQMWRHKCTVCGCEPRAIATELELRARVRELEWQLRDLEAKLGAGRS
jgi:hypothetical protein